MKVGFVAIIGRPNVGKSTFLNTLMQLNIAIVSEKPQTTRDDIKGIYNDKESQIIFVDTPGIHKPKSEFGTILNEKAYKELEGVDLVLFLSPSDEKIGPGDQFIIDKIKDIKNKVAIITKSDLELRKEILDEKAQYLKSKGFISVMTVSTKNLRTKSQVISLIKEYIKEGEPFYDTNTVTDRPKDFIVKEIIRESAIQLLKAEVPHSIAVSINEYSHKDNIVYVNAVIFVERDSQRGILIGNQASMIKEIGKRARLKLQDIIKEKVHMKLEVKVSKNWTKNIDKIHELGY